MRFSERIGQRQTRTAIQVDSMDDELRAGLWNVFFPAFIEPLAGRDVRTRDSAARRIRTIWDEHLKRPIDNAPVYASNANDALKPTFFEMDYLDVYDLVDFTVQKYSGGAGAILESAYNAVLEREVAGFRFVNGILTPISNEYELAAVEEGLALGGVFSGAAIHLKTALSLLSDRTDPDYRNSIKESISAVESAARALTGKPKASLGDLLGALEKTQHIHPAQKEAFSKLYGYTSDEQGIRHAMLEESDIGFAEAKYMLVVCAAFVAYLHAEG